MLTPEVARPHYENLLAAGKDWEPDWLQDARHRAFSHFESVGLPTRKEEAWKYTDVAPIRRADFSFPPHSEAAGASEFSHALSWVAPEGHRAAVVNGAYSFPPSPASKKEKGLKVSGLRDALRDAPDEIALLFESGEPASDQAFAALNMALTPDGVVIQVAAGQTIEMPIHLIMAMNQQGLGTMVHPRVLVHLGRGSQATLIQEFQGEAGPAYLNNIVTDVPLEDGAHLTHHLWQQEGPSSFHLGRVAVRVGRDGHYRGEHLWMGGRISRNEVDVTLKGENASCALNALTLGDGEAHLANHSRVVLAKAHTRSEQDYRDSQKIDAQQSNRNLLLSPDAGVDAKPQLEIFADDVTCSHGCTVGQLDPEQLFYLQSRGLDRAHARHLLTEAFVADLTGQMGTGAVADAIQKRVQARLAELQASGEGT
jgi:Fe-S cluster assembly protein SufD